MKLMFTVAAGIVGLASYSIDASATPISSHETSWQGPQQTLLMLVDQKQEGIVNERSTGNEPFMGPGASGGPKHSAPGATEKTMEKSMRGDSGTGKSGSTARAEDRGPGSGGSQSGGAPSGSSGSGSSSGSGR